MTPPQRFAVALRAEMTRRGVRQVDILRATGVKGTTARKWMAGLSLITPRNAALVAEALAAPGLLALCEELRARICPAAGCGRTFTDHTTHFGALYCSARCQSIEQNRRHRARVVVIDELTPKRLRLYRETIDTFCRSCSDAFCPDATCPIQAAGLSPLPLERRARVVA